MQTVQKNFEHFINHFWYQTKSGTEENSILSPSKKEFEKSLQFVSWVFFIYSFGDICVWRKYTDLNLSNNFENNKHPDFRINHDNWKDCALYRIIRITMI